MRIKVVVMLFATLLASATCSRKGVHMSKHRKSRHCNCPTFSQTQPAEEQALAAISPVQ